MKRAVLSLSGGMDSTTVLGWLLANGYEVVQAVGFHYGSKHNPFELAAARKVAAFYNVPFQVLDLSGVMAGFRSNLMTGQGEIPEGHYTDASMSQTVVPGRNIIFLSILAGVAWSVEAEKIGIGIHQGDHAIYPDCRARFFHSMNVALGAGTDNRVSIEAPFLSTDKTGILKWGLANGVPYHLTRTCYKEQEKACGHCGSCVERLEAFANVGQADPVPYE
jgi:7-cyano-7-deazaguanine synthase